MLILPEVLEILAFTKLTNMELFTSKHFDIRGGSRLL